MLICSMSLFTACNDDDDNGGEGPQLGKDIAGTYNGELSVVSSELKLPGNKYSLLLMEQMM